MALFERRRRAAEELREEISETVDQLGDGTRAAMAAFVTVTLVALVALTLATYAVVRVRDL